jgi:hypothetical protein
MGEAVGVGAVKQAPFISWTKREQSLSESDLSPAILAQALNLDMPLVAASKSRRPLAVAADTPSKKG